MKVVVTGAKGQLGTDLVLMLQKIGIEVVGYGRKELDITNLEEVKQVLNFEKPDVVIHSAAYTKVDLAETKTDDAYLVNAIGTRNIVLISEELGAKLVYISTDYVFDGTTQHPLNEFESTNPVGVYGKSKLAGENFVKEFSSRYFIVRTSWVYGAYGNNFVNTMLKLGKEKDELKVVDDQIGSPTYTLDLTERIIDLIKTEKFGTYHISNSEHCSWYDFAVAIFEEADINVRVIPCSSQEFVRPAPRPAYSVMDHMALRLNGFIEMRHWREGLREFLENDSE